MYGYSSVNEKEFNREKDPREIVRKGTILSRAARAGVTSQEQLDKKLRKLKTNPLQFAPSDEREFAKYFRWVSQTQGEDVARRLVADWRQEKARQQLRRQVIR